MTKNQTCLLCGYKNAMSITQEGVKTLVYCHNGCDHRDLYRAYCDQEGIEKTPIPEYRREPRPRDPEKNIIKANNLWNQSVVIGDRYKMPYGLEGPIKGQGVIDYLFSRGVTDPIPEAIRSHYGLKHYPSELTFPAMVARITNLEGKLTGIHRTYLDCSGPGKAPVDAVKKTLGETKGHSVKLAPAGETLLITEGIENGLIAMQATGLPVWVAMYAGNIPNLDLPPFLDTENIIIVADNDVNDVGIEMARRFAERWYRKYRVRICMPPQPGTDIADYFLWDLP